MNIKAHIKKTLLSLVISTTLMSSSYASQDNILSVKISPNKHHTELIQVIDDLVSQYHLTPTALNNKQAEIFLPYLVEELDQNKLFLTQSETEQVLQLKGLTYEKEYFLMSLYKAYNTILNRKVEYLSKSISLMDNSSPLFDYSIKESLVKADSVDTFAKTEEERSLRLKKYLKFQLLELMLNDKTENEAKELLSKRFSSQINNISTLNSEDVFQQITSIYLRSVEFHTDYLSPIGEESFNESMNLKMEGIGARLNKEDDYITVMELISGGPAHKTKAIHKGDRIISAKQEDGDWTDLVGKNVSQAVKHIKGKKGTSVYLKLLSESDDYLNPKIVKIVRDEIELDDYRASYKIKEEGGVDIAVIQVPSFYQGVSMDIDRLLKEINEKDVSGVILDLRNNGGGSLPEAIKLSGLFIKTGLVVQVKGAKNKIKEMSDQDERVSYADKLIVLVNENSASASEIVAASLQDHNRAVIVGNQTFGKGTVQNHIPLEALRKFIDADVEKLGGINLTIAKFYRPNGESTQLKGVMPDISLPSEYDASTIGESSHKFVLKNDAVENKLSLSPNLSKPMAFLNQRFNSRLSSVAYLKFIEADLFIKKKAQGKDNVSLNYEDRLLTRKERKTFYLNKINKYLEYKGYEPIENVDDIRDRDYDLDYELDETLIIMKDWLDYTKKSS